MSEDAIIGRKKEKEILNRVWQSKEAEFVALYGRRRVGKTHLIRQFFAEKGIYLEVSRAKDKSMKKQLENFMKGMSNTFFNNVPLATPSNWEEAFELLTKQIKTIASQKVILFFDELPWMATKRSQLLQSIDYYWNLYWSVLPNVILVACGSAASWMLEKLIYAKGGLHKRITQKILLEPYKLKEAEEFLKSRSLKLSQKQILDIYMVTGGIPFYLKGVHKGKSAAQVIDELCFQKNGLLYDEFENLFESLFEHAQVNLAIIREIVRKGNGVSRDDLIKATGLKSGGTMNKRLKELEASGFIQHYIPLGRIKRDRYYRVIDEFSLFHLKWIEPYLSSKIGVDEEDYWQNLTHTPTVSSWAGYAYENVCLKHLYQIRKALEFDRIASKTGSWRYVPQKGAQEEGAQIDLLFDRQDAVITLCEIKYSDKPYTIDKFYAKQLMRKIDVFEKHFKTEKQLFVAMITTMGLKPSIWSEELVQNSVQLSDLFT